MSSSYNFFCITQKCIIIIIIIIALQTVLPIYLKLVFTYGTRIEIYVIRTFLYRRPYEKLPILYSSLCSSIENTIQMTIDLTGTTEAFMLKPTFKPFPWTLYTVYPVMRKGWAKTVGHNNTVSPCSYCLFYIPPHTKQTKLYNNRICLTIYRAKLQVKVLFAYNSLMKFNL